MMTKGNFWQGLTDYSRGKQDDFAAGYDWDADGASQSDYYTKFNKAGQDARNNYWNEATNAAQKSTWDAGSDWDLSSFNADGVDPDAFRKSVSHKGQGLYNVGDNYWFDRDSDAKFDSDKTFSNEGDAWAWMTAQGDDLTKGKFADFQAPWQQAQQQTWGSSPQWGNPWQQAWNPWTPPWAYGWGNPWMNLPQPNFQTPQTTTTTTADEAADLNAAKAKEAFRLSGEEAAQYYNELTGSGYTHDDALSAAQEWYPNIDFSNWTYDSHTGATPPAELVRRERPPVVEETATSSTEGLIAPDNSYYEQKPEFDQNGNPTGGFIQPDTSLYDWINEKTGKRATVEAGYTAAEGSGWKRLGRSGAGEKEGTPPKVEFTNSTDWWSDGAGGVTPDVSQLLYNVLFEVPQGDGTMGLAKINEKVNLTDENGDPSGTVWRDADHNMWYHPEGGQPMRIDKFATSLATAETETLNEALRDADTEKKLLEAAADKQHTNVSSAIDLTQIKLDAAARAAKLLKDTESAATQGDLVAAGTELQDDSDSASAAKKFSATPLGELAKKESDASITGAGTGKINAVGGALGSLLNTSGESTGAIDSAISEAEQAKIDASDRLTAAEKSYADLYESDILDRLRGAKLRGQRATEFGTAGSTNRLLLQAEAQAAKDAARLRSGSDVAAAKRELGFAETRAEAQLKNAAEGEMRDLGLNQQYINRNLGNIDQTIDRKLENELKADMRKLNLADDYINEKFQNALTKANGDYAAASTAIMRELGYGEDSINQRLQNARDAKHAELQSLVTRETQKMDAAKKMAAVYGSTPEETYGMVTLAENMVEQAALEGEIGEANEQAIYDAMVQAANLFAKNPSIYELYSNMAAQDMDLADLWKSMEDTLAQSRIANIAAIPGMAQAAIDYDPWMQLQNSYYGPAMAQWPYMGAFGFGNTSTIPTTAYGSNLYPALPNLGYQGAIEAARQGRENNDDMWRDFLNTNIDGYFNP